MLIDSSLPSFPSVSTNFGKLQHGKEKPSPLNWYDLSTLRSSDATWEKQHLCRDEDLPRLPLPRHGVLPHPVWTGGAASLFKRAPSSLNWKNSRRRTGVVKSQGSTRASVQRPIAHGASWPWLQPGSCRFGLGRTHADPDEPAEAAPSSRHAVAAGHAARTTHDTAAQGGGVSGA